MAAFRFSIFIEAPPELVFDLWNDVDRWPEWIVGLTKVTDVSGPLDRVGTTYLTWFGSRIAGRSAVLEVERPRRIRTHFGNWLLQGHSEVTFEPQGSGTRLTQVLETEGLIPAISGRIFATGSYRGSFRGELNTFKALAEGRGR